MNTYMKIAVIGGTGKSGRYLVNQLLMQDYQLQMLVRNPEHFTFTSPNIIVINGDVTDISAVTKTLKGCSAVISTLGLGIPPSSPDIFTKATTNILTAMAKTGINRYIVTTGLNVNMPHDNKGITTQMATDWMYDNYPASTQNKQEEYELLTQSPVAWTMLRLPMIQLTDENPEIAVNLKDCPGDAISATALARFLVSQLEDTQYLRKAPFIANK